MKYLINETKNSGQTIPTRLFITEVIDWLTSYFDLTKSLASERQPHSPFALYSLPCRALLLVRWFLSFFLIWKRVWTDYFGIRVLGLTPVLPHPSLLCVILTHIKANKINKIFADLVCTEQPGLNLGRNYLWERWKRK